jgi:methionyl-tRNA synthetase
MVLQSFPWLADMVWLIPLLIWEAVWKAIGLWKSGTQKQLAWFICIFVFNTAGILPIIYLAYFQKKKIKRNKIKK